MATSCLSSKVDVAPSTHGIDVLKWRVYINTKDRTKVITSTTIRDTTEYVRAKRSRTDPVFSPTTQVHRGRIVHSGDPRALLLRW
jgi:hypothetical protein